MHVLGEGTAIYTGAAPEKRTFDEKPVWEGTSNLEVCGAGVLGRTGPGPEWGHLDAEPGVC